MEVAAGAASAAAAAGIAAATVVILSILLLRLLLLRSVLLPLKLLLWLAILSSRPLLQHVLELLLLAHPCRRANAANDQLVFPHEMDVPAIPRIVSP